MRWVPLSWSAKNKEERVAALWDQISGPNPSMTPQQFLSRIANLKASKHVIQSGDESDSDDSDHDSEVQSEPEAIEDNQPAQPNSQGQRKCNSCHGVPEEWKIFQCGHPICSLCAELLNSRRRPIDRKCHVCSKPIQNAIPFLFFPRFHGTVKVNKSIQSGKMKQYKCELRYYSLWRKDNLIQSDILLNVKCDQMPFELS